MHGRLPSNRTEKESKSSFMGYLGRAFWPNCNTVRSFSAKQTGLRKCLFYKVYGGNAVIHVSPC